MVSGHRLLTLGLGWAALLWGLPLCAQIVVSGDTKVVVEPAQGGSPAIRFSRGPRPEKTDEAQPGADSDKDKKPDGKDRDKDKKDDKDKKLDGWDDRKGKYVRIFRVKTDPEEAAALQRLADDLLHGESSEEA